jgi:hypothetical protein
MNNWKTIGKLKATLTLLLVSTVILCFFSCKRERQNSQLDSVTIHDNPLVIVQSKPEILLEHLNNPAAPLFIGERTLFAEGGKGVVYEYKDGKAISLIEGFGLDSYGGYPISVLGMTSVPDSNHLIVAASQDDGHIFIFDTFTFPTNAKKGREIEMKRTEPHNPFGVLLAKKGKLLAASGGTKSVYHAPFDTGDPSPLIPVFDVVTGVEGMVEDERTGFIYGAEVGTGQNDGALIRWNPDAEKIEPEKLAKGFTNFVGVTQMSNGLLLLLEFGGFEKPGTGRLSVVDLANPTVVHPIISGFDSPSGLSLKADNTVLITTFGKSQDKRGGMLLSLKLAFKQIS